MKFLSKIFGRNKVTKEDMAGFFKEAAREYAAAQAEEVKKAKEEDNRNWMERDGKLDEKYLFDFKPQWESTRGGVFMGVEGVVPMNDGPNEGGGENEEKKVVKLSKKPIDVVDELEKQPNPFTLVNLDDKIEMVKDKVEIIEQYYAKREMKGLLERLENRKKYDKHKKFYEQFPNTNMESIDKLLDKYNLVMKESDLFIPEFPKEAIDVMKRYNRETKKLCGKEPKYYVIAEEEKFKKAYEKRDPILLVQSPFGFYYQVLGAWDEEMLIVSEL